MQIIRDHLTHWDRGLPRTVLSVDRLTLARRRWRGAASDGVEFGFDLDYPLADGDVFFADGATCYHLAQQSEPVLQVALISPLDAVQVGWNIGNLHFQIAVTDQTILAPDDPAIRQMLERERIPYQPAKAVFRPLGGGHSHGHHTR